MHFLRITSMKKSLTKGCLPIIYSVQWTRPRKMMNIGFEKKKVLKVHPWSNLFIKIFVNLKFFHHVCVFWILNYYLYFYIDWSVNKFCFFPFKKLFLRFLDFNKKIISVFRKYLFCLQEANDNDCKLPFHSSKQLQEIFFKCN